MVPTKGVIMKRQKHLKLRVKQGGKWEHVATFICGGLNHAVQIATAFRLDLVEARILHESAVCFEYHSLTGFKQI
jgi:hypothetical protein